MRVFSFLCPFLPAYGTQICWKKFSTQTAQTDYTNFGKKILYKAARFIEKNFLQKLHQPPTQISTEKSCISYSDLLKKNFLQKLQKLPTQISAEKFGIRCLDLLKKILCRNCTTESLYTNLCRKIVRNRCIFCCR